MSARVTTYATRVPSGEICGSFTVTIFAKSFSSENGLGAAELWTASNAGRVQKRANAKNLFMSSPFGWSAVLRLRNTTFRVPFLRLRNSPSACQSFDCAGTRSRALGSAQDDTIFRTPFAFRVPVLRLRYGTRSRALGSAQDDTDAQDDTMASGSFATIAFSRIVPGSIV